MYCSEPNSCTCLKTCCLAPLRSEQKRTSRLCKFLLFGTGFGGATIVFGGARFGRKLESDSIIPLIVVCVVGGLIVFVTLSICFCAYRCSKICSTAGSEEDPLIDEDAYARAITDYEDAANDRWAEMEKERKRIKEEVDYANQLGRGTDSNEKWNAEQRELLRQQTDRANAARINADKNEKSLATLKDQVKEKKARALAITQ